MLIYINYLYFLELDFFLKVFVRLYRIDELLIKSLIILVNNDYIDKFNQNNSAILVNNLCNYVRS